MMNRPETHKTISRSRSKTGAAIFLANANIMPVIYSVGNTILQVASKLDFQADTMFSIKLYIKQDKAAS